MIKIITYIDRIFDKRNGYSRAESGDESDKNSKKTSNRVYAEEELDRYLNEGWSIVSASSSEMVTGVLGSTTSFSKLTVILQKR
ncbi:MAG: hypothetical protein J1F24_01285 [Oscillospiraceae bacterium]|nr:hypothetical protein [Oscillospiraceae bacterium]